MAIIHQFSSSQWLGIIFIFVALLSDWCCLPFFLYRKLHAKLLIISQRSILDHAGCGKEVEPPFNFYDLYCIPIEIFSAQLVAQLSIKKMGEIGDVMRFMTIFVLCAIRCADYAVCAELINLMRCPHPAFFQCCRGNSWVALISMVFAVSAVRIKRIEL